MKRINLFLLLVALTISFSAWGGEKITLQRLEPSSWWVGMKNPEVQLMVYGHDIGSTEVQFDIPGVQLASVQTVENKNYLFINLVIGPTAKPGKYLIQFLENKKLVAKSDFQLFERNTVTPAGSGYNSSDVIYLIMSDRFSNGDPKNDASKDVIEGPNRKDPNGRHGGDIQGIINHLDYLQELGVTAVWNTPMMEDNMENFSYHTYAITDYYKIDPRFGTNSDYQRLGSELHKRNMKLIMDVVTNHCGLNYYWMKDLPTQDWIHQFKTFTRSNYKISCSFDPYVSQYDKNRDLNGWFDYSMPDMNQDNPLVLKFLIQNTIWWIEYAGLDGLRVDTYPYNSPSGIATWTKAIRDEYPNINIVGECWVGSAQESAYFQTGSKNKDGYDTNLPTVMDFPLREAIIHAMDHGKEFGSVDNIYSRFTLDYLFGNPFNIMIFTENHDTPRFNELIGRDITKFKLAYTLLLTTRGIPQLYYGSEIMMGGNKDKGDGDICQDFPGGWPEDTINAFQAKGRTALQNEAFDFMKKMLQWRKANPVIAHGKMMQFIPENNVYVYFRYDDSKKIMVILNLNNKENTLDTRRFQEMMDGYTSAHDVISDKEFNDLSSISVAAGTSMVLELKK